MLKKDSSKASKIKSPFQFLTCNIGQFIQFLLANKEGVITQRQYSVRTFRENQQKLATLFNPFAPETPVTARADPGPFYPL